MQGDHAEAQKSESAEDPLPSMLWGLDPVHGVFAKLYIKDILELKNSCTVPGVFFYKTHPITKVDILGTVVQKREREKFVSFGVDDGTGVISCLCWKKQRTSENIKPASSSFGLNLLEQLNKITQLEQRNSQLDLGDIVHVRGWLKDYREQREINSTSVSKIADPVFTAQIARMLELPYLYRNFYDKTFEIPTDSPEPNQQGMKTLSLQRKIKQFLNQTRVKNFYQQELEAIDSLVCIAQQDQVSTYLQEHSAQTLQKTPCVSRQIHEVFQEAVCALQEEGIIFQKVAGPSKLYLVTDEAKELHNVTLRIIQDDSTRPKHVDKGCPFLHIVSCVRHSYSAGVSEAAVQRVLDRLECNSEIISTMDRHYTAA
ncbi:CST complex subunit STN1 [Rhincodon typus]|uniref:CST complex subunit STN1 n=1 Tax=Rhincodon typus TaxID=259920 RepID=UPI002030378C|nr:CST complex subunit STN1 [Rhincodon typus]XP_048464829.1 CST complex subunit STN1 [Rhincodon typus]